MKRLLLLRHAKSAWNAPATGDHDRPLSGRGRQAAARMGRFLAASGPVPDRIVSSSALRALDTARRLARAADLECPIEETSDLYTAAAEAALRVIGDETDATQTLLLVGHEPMCSELLSRLVGAAEVRMPTAALARIDLPVERWDDVRFGQGRLAWLVTPRLLARAGLGEDEA